MFGVSNTSSSGNNVRFHIVLGDEFVQGLDDDILGVIVDAGQGRADVKIGDLFLATGSLKSTQHAVNYTTDQTVFSTLTQVEPSAHPEYGKMLNPFTAGVVHCINATQKIVQSQLRRRLFKGGV